MYTGYEHLNFLLGVMGICVSHVEISKDLIHYVQEVLCYSRDPCFRCVPSQVYIFRKQACLRTVPRKPPKEKEGGSEGGTGPGLLCWASVGVRPGAPGGCFLPSDACGRGFRRLLDASGCLSKTVQGTCKTPFERLYTSKDANKGSQEADRRLYGRLLGHFLNEF